jgi:hypothetical protein
MRETRQSGSEGGGNELNHFSLPLSRPARDGDGPTVVVTIHRGRRPAGDGRAGQQPLIQFVFAAPVRVVRVIRVFRAIRGSAYSV